MVVFAPYHTTKENGAILKCTIFFYPELLPCKKNLGKIHEICTRCYGKKRILIFYFLIKMGFMLYLVFHI
jgi:hypothetical protein